MLELSHEIDYAVWLFEFLNFYFVKIKIVKFKN